MHLQARLEVTAPESEALTSWGNDMETVTLWKSRFAACAIGLSLCAAAVQAAAPDKGWREEFETTGEISGLADQRIAFVDSSHYRPYDERQQDRRSKMIKHSNAGNCEKASTYARKILRRYPFAILANRTLEHCLRKAGEPEKAAYYGYLGDTLFLILLSEGRGTGPNDQVRVITVMEALDFMDLSGYVPMRVVTDRTNLAHLVIEGMSNDGSQAHFYFNDEFIEHRRMRIRQLR